MRLALVRHLPTQANRDGLLQGRRDPPILPPDDETRAAIARNRLSLAGRFASFDHVLVSSLRRTAMTAEAYGYGELAQVEPLLDELDFGPYEGRLRSEMLRELGDRWVEAPQTLMLGEPISALGARVRSVLSRYGGCQSLLIFGHGAWLRALRSLIEQGDLGRMNRMTIQHNAVSVVELSGHASKVIRER